MEIDKLAGLVSEFGLPVFLISIITIFLIGALKYFGVFKKIENAGFKKAIYYGLDIVLSFGITALYYAIFGLPFVNYVAFCLKAIPCVTVVYAIYENFGLRKFVHFIGTFIVSKVAKAQVEAEKNKIEKKGTESVKEKNTSITTTVS